MSLSSLLQSKYFKAFLSVCVLVLTFVSLTAFASWSSPSPASNSRSTFINLGPATQTKIGRLNVTNASSVITSAQFEVAGPAQLGGGVSAGAQSSNTAAIVLGDVFVGYQGSPALAPSTTQATSSYVLNGNVMVSDDVKAGNLSHTNTGGLEPVCTDTNGWLIPCTETSSVPQNLPVYCGIPEAANYPGNAVLLTPLGGAPQFIIDNDLCYFNYANPVPQGCFIEGTMVKMANGTYKDIKDVQIGESLQSSVGPEIVMKKYAIDYVGKLYKINNSSEYFVSDSHPFMTTEGWKSFDPAKTLLESPTLEVSKLQLGDTLIKEGGIQEVLESFDFIETNETVYNFGLNGTRDFYADGYLVHNVDLFPIAQALPAVGSKGLCDSYTATTHGYTFTEWQALCNGDGGSDPITCNDNPCNSASTGNVCCSQGGSASNFICMSNPAGMPAGQVCAP